VDWAEAAHQTGYHDQGHLIRDFRELAGARRAPYWSRRVPGQATSILLEQGGQGTCSTSLGAGAPASVGQGDPMRHWNIAAGVVTLAVAAGPACGVRDFLEEGRQQSWFFTTARTGNEVRAMSVAQLERDGYRVVRNETQFVEGEKQTDADSVDVVRMSILGFDNEGTRVRVQALTEDLTAGGRRQARFVSGSAVQDGGELVDVLMLRNPVP
jgi:hypothetical protein